MELGIYGSVFRVAVFLCIAAWFGFLVSVGVCLCVSACVCAAKMGRGELEPSGVSAVMCSTSGFGSADRVTTWL